MAEMELFRPGTPRLRASATPVDTFVRPRAEAEPVRPPTTNTFLQIADALKSVEPKLNRYLEARHGEHVREQEALGIQAELKGAVDGIETNRLGWRQLIENTRKEDGKNGTRNAEILLGQSPHFKRGYQRSQADNMGMAFYDALLTKWGENPEVQLPDGSTTNLHQSDNPVALQAFISEQTQAFMEENDVGRMDPSIVQEVLIPRLQQARGQLANRQAEFRLGEQRREYTEEFSNNVQMLIGGIIANGDVGAGVQEIQQRLDSAVQDGLPPREANEALVQAVISAARTSGDSSILRVLGAISTGNGQLGNVSWVQEAVTTTREQINNRQFTLEKHNAWREDRARAKKSREISAGVVAALVSDPTADIQDYQEQFIEAGDPESALQIAQQQERLISARRSARDDDVAVNAVYAQIYAGPSEEARKEILSDITELGASGRATPQTLRYLYETFERQVENEDYLGELSVRQAAASVESTVQARFNGFDGRSPEDDTRGLSAKNQFNDELSEWISTYRQENEGVDPSRSAIREAANQIQSRILSSPQFQSVEGRGDLNSQTGPVTEAQRKDVAEVATGEEGVFALAQLMGAGPGTVTFNRETLSGEEAAALVSQHIKSPSSSLLSRLAEQHKTTPLALAQALTGVGSPLTPSSQQQQPSLQGPVDPIQQEPESEPLNIDLDEGSLSLVDEILGTSLLDPNVPEEFSSAPLFDALRERGILKAGPENRRTGEVSYELDFEAGLAAIEPLVLQWGEQAGIDTSLLTPGDVVLDPSNPAYPVASDLGLGRKLTSGRRNRGSITGRRLDARDKLELILHLME